MYSSETPFTEASNGKVQQLGGFYINQSIKGLEDPLISGIVQHHAYLIVLNEFFSESVHIWDLYRHITSEQDYILLQQKMDNLVQWDANWQMKFNIFKYHSIRVTRHTPCEKITFEYVLHNQTLEQVQSIKYLGITISGDSNFCQKVLGTGSYSTATKPLGFLNSYPEAWYEEKPSKLCTKSL